jgi:hypothetical protein
MTRFNNGRSYARISNLVFLDTKVPYTEMSVALRIGHAFTHKPVLGRIDTGADRTLFNRATATSLGLNNIICADTEKLSMADGREIQCYLHCVDVLLRWDRASPPLHLPLMVGFAESDGRNIFGMDLLLHAHVDAVALDRYGTYLLSDSLCNWV